MNTKNNMNKDKMTLCHFNPDELDFLDEMQGGTHYMGNSDVRHYGPLEEKFKQPHIEKIIMKEYERHAKGGQVGDLLRKAHEMRMRGRNGDIDVAFLGPHTIRILNKAMHGGSINPVTKKPEFFNLGGVFKSIGHTIRGGVDDIGKTLGGIGHTVGNLGSDAVNAVGGAVNDVGNMVGQGVNYIGNNLGNALPGAILGGMEGGPMGALIGGATDMAMNSGNGGGNHSNGSNNYSAPSSLAGIGQQFMNSSYGQKAMNMGNNLYNQASTMYNQAIQNPYVQSGIGAYNGYQMAQNQQNPEGPQRQMFQPPSSLSDLGNQFSNSSYGQNLRSQGSNLYNQANNRYQNAMENYAQQPNRMENFMQTNPYAQAASAGYNAYQNAQGGGYGQQTNYGSNPYGSGYNNSGYNGYNY